MSDPRLHSVLWRRLVEVLALEPTDAFNADTARQAIVGSQIEGAMCAPLIVDGKRRTGHFANWYAAVFGRELDGRAIKRAQA